MNLLHDLPIHGKSYSRRLFDGRTAELQKAKCRGWFHCTSPFYFIILPQFLSSGRTTLIMLGNSTIRRREQPDNLHFNA